LAPALGTPTKVLDDVGRDRIHLIVDLVPSVALAGLLKPITFRDRVRFTKHRVEFYGQVARTFTRFVRTREGRARIRAKTSQVLRLSA